MQRAQLLSGLALLVSIFGISETASAAVPVSVPASDGSSGDHFGFSVAISGNTAIVGAPGDDARGALSGSAYIFAWSGSAWTLQAKLTASDGAAQASFGQAVSLSGDTAVIGAPYGAVSGTPAGAVYVFVRSGTSWTQQAKLSANDFVAFDFFGSTVSLSGSTIVIGSPYSDVFGADSGAAYVFSRSGLVWSQEAKIAPPDGRTNDLFGSSVSISGSTVAVGAPNDDDNAVASGSAYVYVKSGGVWAQQQKIRPTDGQNGDLFGNAIAVSANDLVIGAPEQDAVGIAAGAAYVYTRNGGWSLQQKLTGADISTGDFFGAAVALSGNTAVIGAFLDSGAHSGSGSAYRFSRSGTTWAQTEKLIGPGGANDNFGAAVALDGSRALIGVDQDDDLGTDSGSAVYYDFDAVAAVPALPGSAVFTLGVAMMFIGVLATRRGRRLGPAVVIDTAQNV